MTRHLMIITQNVDEGIYLVKEFLVANGRQYRVFYGSNFPGDRSDQQLYRVINQIVDCVENGIICVLVGLDEIYQTFYDLLNQKYMETGGKSFCRIAFGTDSRRIHVHPDFKFILVQDQVKSRELDPPLLNRFEKHLYRLELNAEQTELFTELQAWVQKVNASEVLLPFADDQNLRNLIFVAEKQGGRG